MILNDRLDQSSALVYSGFAPHRTDANWNSMGRHIVAQTTCTRVL